MGDWSNAELNKLRALYHTMSLDSLVDKLDKSDAEILSMAHKLKLDMQRSSSGGIITRPRPGILIHRVGF